MKKIQKTISDTATEAVPCIAYKMPTFKLHKKPLVYFAAFKNHIGLYAPPSGDEAFPKELSKYKTGKGSIKFLLGKYIPYDLIKRIMEFRVIEVNESMNQSINQLINK